MEHLGKELKPGDVRINGGGRCYKRRPAVDRRAAKAMNEQAFLEELQSIGRVLRDEPMSRHTTFGVGGPADFYIKVEDRASLRDAMLEAVRHELPYCVLGSGSNVLVGDAGIRGLVIENNAQSMDGPEDFAPELADCGWILA